MVSELAAIVDRLGRECPWTKSQSTADMLFWLRKEIIEVEEVLRSPDRDTTKLTKELGDCLFDVLMAIECTRRQYPEVTLGAVQASAVEKVKRRCPYVFGDAAPAASVAEAEAAWQAAKGRERSAALLSNDESTSLSSFEEPQQFNAGLTQAEVQSLLQPPEQAPTAQQRKHDRGQMANLAAPADESDDSFDAGLTEWENDYKRDAGPPSDSEDESGLE